MVAVMLAFGIRALYLWKSVLTVSGGKPCSMAGTAMRNQKLPPPWPRSNRTPLSRASRT